MIEALLRTHYATYTDYLAEQADKATLVVQMLTERADHSLTTQKTLSFEVTPELGPLFDLEGREDRSESIFYDDDQTHLEKLSSHHYYGDDGRITEVLNMIGLDAEL
jgi:hypothetical protein